LGWNLDYASFNYFCSFRDDGDIPKRVNILNSWSMFCGNLELPELDQIQFIKKLLHVSVD